MRRLLQFIPVMLIAIGALMLCERAAYAYADPGTGLLAIQAAGSALVATGWYLRRKIYALLHRSPKAKTEEYSSGKEDESSALR